MDFLETEAQKFGIDSNDDLYVACCIAVASRSNIVVSSVDLDYTGELMLKYAAFWMKTSTCIDCIVEMDNTSWLEQFLYRDTAGVLRVREFVILKRSGRLAMRLQQLLLNVLNDGHIKHGDQCIEMGRFFSLISLVEDDDGVEREFFHYLQIEFLFRQVHEGAEMVRDNSAESSIHSTDWFKNLREAQAARPQFERLINQAFEESKAQAGRVAVIPEIRQYMCDIIVRLRMNRFVARGVSARVLSQLESLVRYICVYMNFGYATPGLVKTAAQKLLPMKVTIVRPADEPTLLWGSDLELVSSFIERITVDMIILQVLSAVQAPI